MDFKAHARSEGLGRTVLVVGGDASTATELQRALGEAGLDAIVLASVSHVRAWIKNGSRFSPEDVDGIVGAVVELDLLGDSSERVAVEIGTFSPGAFVVGLTGQVTWRQSIALLEQGIACIPKPVPARDLAALFRARLRRRHLSGYHRSNHRAGDTYVVADSAGSQGDANVTSARALIRNVSNGSGAASKAPVEQHMDNVLLDCVLAYVSARALSAAQQGVLLRYLEGMNDKEIAAASGCTESTVYEHWRRMARKANTQYKGGVVADFHRFLRERMGGAIAAAPRP